MSQKKHSKRGDEKVDKFKDNLIIALICVVFVLIAAIVGTSINPADEVEKGAVIVERDNVKEPQDERLRYWGVNVDKWHENGPLRTMNRAFERLNYKFVNASNGDDWDILWSIEHPGDAVSSDEGKILFAGIHEKQLRPDQKANHFDGIEALINKAFMNKLNKDSPYILPFFIMPKDFDKLNKFLKQNPNVSIVEKNMFNRGVRILKFAKIREHSSEYFYQQFMDDHLLIDGHAFDMGIYVLITSFNPLRIYRYNADVLFRFCVKKYHPFDPKDVDKYVVQEGAHFAHEMPTFEKIYKNYRFPFIKVFERIIVEKGYVVKDFWRRIDDAIINIVSNAESTVIEELKLANHSGQNYFELVRFDFLVDNKFNPYVMEVNMSPNLTPANRKNEESIRIYEPMIYNTIQMIGGASYFEFHSRFNNSDVTIASAKHIATGVEHCLKHKCHRDCSDKKCSICLPCASAADRYQMREAVREHNQQGNFKRLFPTTLHYYNEKLISKMTERNQVSIAWYKAQCESDDRWC